MRVRSRYSWHVLLCTLLIACGAWAQDTILNPEPVRVATTVRLDQALVVVVLPALDPNGALVKDIDFEVHMTDPNLPAALRDDAILIIRRLARYAGKIE